jgi:hypothetical protein
MKPQILRFDHRLWTILLAGLFWLAAQSTLADIRPFVGHYKGSAEIVDADGSSMPRDMSVTIEEAQKGFSVKWTTITHKSRGRTKEETYNLSFVPTDRAGVFAAAMKRNLFGHEAQMDPMKGEPYVWARIVDDTLTVFSLFVNDAGGYELQQFDRTLANGGLDLKFSRIANGKEMRTVNVFLDKE